MLTVDSPNYMGARPLLVILHDPPEMIASPDPHTGKIELHNTWVVSNAAILLLLILQTDC